jgi:hypothetical protein
MGKLFKIALALFLIGVGVFAVFTVISEEPIWGLVNDEDYLYNELTYDADEFTGFDFDFDNRDFIVGISEDDKIKITYYTTERDNVTVTDSGDTLKLFNDIEWTFTLFSGWNSIINDEDYFDVEVFLPASVIYDVDFNSSNGSLDMVGINNIDVLKFATSNGRIDIDNCNATSMDFYTSNGTIELTTVEAIGLIKIKTSNGKIKLTDVEAGSIEAKSSNQKITGVNITCSDVDFDTSNGSISLSIYGDKEDFEVFMETSNGDMTYDGVGVSQEEFNIGEDNKIKLDTSNGNIELIFIAE